MNIRYDNFCLLTYPWMKRDVPRGQADHMVCSPTLGKTLSNNLTKILVLIKSFHLHQTSTQTVEMKQ